MIVFPLLFFRSPSSFPSLFLLISFLLSSRTVTRVVFSQLGAIYYTRIDYTDCHIPNISYDCFSASPIPISLRTRHVFSPFGAAYFYRGTCTNYEILNFIFLACFSASSFSVFIIRFLYLQIFAWSLTARHSRQNSVFPEFTGNFKFFFPFNVSIVSLIFVSSSFTSAYRFFMAIFSFGFRLGTLAPSYRRVSAPLDWSSAIAFRFPRYFRLPPSLPI